MPASTDHWFNRLAWIAQGRDLARPLERAPRSRDTGTPPAHPGAAGELIDDRDELQARRNTRPLGNVVRLPTRGGAA